MIQDFIAQAAVLRAASPKRAAAIADQSQEDGAGS